MLASAQISKALGISSGIGTMNVAHEAVLINQGNLKETTSQPSAGSELNGDVGHGWVNGHFIVAMGEDVDTATERHAGTRRDASRARKTPQRAQLARCEPVYETLPGWTQPTLGIRKFSELPGEAQRYIRRLEEVSGAPAAIISTGSERDHTIVREDTAASSWLR